jgi:membrane fusion protein, copper/silver efflux system
MNRINRARWIPWAAIVGVLAILMVVPTTRRSLLDFFEIGTATTEADVYYTCPMHPQIDLPQPGECPICGMTLVKKERGQSEGTGVVAVTPQQIQLTGVTVTPVERRDLARTINAYGNVDYDETRLGVVSAWVGGRIDKLFVDFTGTTVQKGHALVSLYSPQLISTENEYLVALTSLHNAEKSGMPQAVTSAKALVESSRQRLLRWGLGEQQLDHIAQTNEVEDHVTIYAPQGGTVIEKKAYEGMYVKEGDVLFRIADLSTVWLYAEVYEDDISFLYQDRPGDYWTCPMHPEIHQKGPGSCPKCGMELVRTNDSIGAVITARALPGDRFTGNIAFTDPFLDPNTRTVRVRVNIRNPDQRLKPNMYARAQIHLPLKNILAVPENAVLQSGTRQIVLVEESPGRFRPQPIRLGRMWLDDPSHAATERKELAFETNAVRYHEVLAGLQPGDRVVNSGNFLLGSESQLQGALTKMLAQTPADSMAGADTTATVAVGFVDEPRIADVLDAYYAIQARLTKDSIETVGTEAQRIVDAAKSDVIRTAAGPLVHAPHKNDIAATRDDFHALSDVLIAYVAQHRAQMKAMPLKAYCPMADAFWLQKGGELVNPYMGSQMPHCGSFESWDEAATGK